MKHILRKLHLGGSHETGFDGQNSQAIGGLSSTENQDSSAASTSSSGLSGWLTNARHTFRPPSSSSSPSNNVSTPARRPESSHLSRATSDVESPHLEGQNNFNLYEEEYQVQLALALSVSNQNAENDDPELLQIKAAKRISLGRPLSPGSNPAESAAHRYWNYNVLDYDEKVVDGFYDVYGVVSDFGTAEKIPSLVDLQSTPLTDVLGYEVVLVNRTIDPDLIHLEQASLCLAVDCGMSGISLQSSELVQKIADLVVQHMGGPVVDANDMLRNWVTKSYELRMSINNIVLPLGCLRIGLSRHRALLFKVLADHVGIPCRLVKGSHYTGTDEGAVNIVKLDSEREYIVDLMGAPGTLLPAESVGTAANIDLFENSALVEELFSQIDKAHNLSTGGNQNPPTFSEQFAAEPSNHSLSGQQAKVFQSLPGKQQNTNDTSTRVPAIGFHVSSEVIDEVDRSKPAHIGLETAMVAPLHLDEEWIMQRNHVENMGGDKASKGREDEAEIQIQTIHERLNSGYMECWKKHVNNKGDPVLENVAEWEIPWEEIVIGERIGLGSYGEVHHGDWRGAEVAVKRFLDQDFFGDALDEFISEVRIMRRMQHPNVVLFLGAVTHPPNLSIVTEYLPRGSLFRLLHRPNCQLDEKLRLKMALDVAEGMNYLHTSNPIIVHRDLKSPNLLVDKNWVAKVCDFGLSRMKHHTFLSSKSTAGTPEWMAPEVLRNELSNEKCDVYSFGVILWELCTLQQPWSGMNPMQVVGAVGFQNRRLDIPKNVDPLVAHIISSCWQSESRLRPTFSELTIALKPLERLLVKY